MTTTQQPESTPLTTEQWKLKLLAKKAKKVRAFLDAGEENREWEAYRATKHRAPWAYSFPLQEVVWYLTQRDAGTNFDHIIEEASKLP
jgi:hypothetical protein